MPRMEKQEAGAVYLAVKEGHETCQRYPEGFDVDSLVDAAFNRNSEET